MRDPIFLGDSLERLKHFPIEAKREIGFALGLVQQGETHDKAKAFKGYPGVLEIAPAYRNEANRAIYTL